MLRPSHRKQGFAAAREFTDREDAQAAFVRALATPQGPDDYRVLVFYGVGGQGKTALGRRLMALARDEGAGVAALDLSAAELRKPEQALLSLRLQLGSSAGLRFPAFDFAFARYVALAYPGTKLQDAYPALAAGESEVIQDLLAFAEAGLSLLPGLNLVFKYGQRFGQAFRAWWARRGREVLAGLDDLDGGELLEALPRYLGADLCDKMGGAGKRLVVFLDSYEAIWRDHPLRTGVGALRADAWLRRLVAETPGALFVVLGRDRLRWGELDAGYEAALEQHLLGGLSDADAEAFLAAVPIPEAEIRRRIVASAAGLPFYLDLQVGLYERLKNAGGLEPEAFGGRPTEVIARFLDHLDAPQLAMLRAVAHARTLDEALFAHLGARFFPGAPLGFAELGEQSFMTRQASGALAMHALLRDYLVGDLARREPERAAALQGALFAWHDARAQADDPRAVGPAQEVALREAAHHLAAFNPSGFPEWCWARGEVFEGAARWGLLEPLYRQALALQEAALGPEHPLLALGLSRLAGVLREGGAFAEAEAVQRREVALMMQALGPEHPETAGSLNNLALVLRARGDFRGAADLYQQAYATLVRTRGEAHASAVNVLANLATVLKDQGQHEGAEALCRRVLELREAALGPEHPEVASALENLGNALQRLGRHRESLPLYARALAIREAALGPEHPKLGQLLSNVARAHKAAGELADAEALHRRALGLLEGALGPGHPLAAEQLGLLADTLWARGRYEEAEALARQALAFQEAALGPEHPHTADCLVALGVVLKLQGKLDEAEGCYRRALAIQETVHGPEHESVAGSLSSLGNLLVTRGEPAAAEPLLRRAVQLLEAALGVEHPEVAAKLGNLAIALQDQGRLADAAALYRRVLAVQEAVFGPEHPNVGFTLNNLAAALSRQGEREEALALVERALAVVSRALGPEHPNVQVVAAHARKLREGPFPNDSA